MVNWLLGKRSRLDGHAIYLNQQIANIQAQLKDVIAKRDALDATIAEYSRAIDVGQIRSVRPTNLKGLRQNYGGRVDAIRSTLARHPGVWMSTSAIVVECAVLLGVNLEHRGYAMDFHWKIQKELGQQARRGLIARNHDLKTNGEGFWALIPLSGDAPKKEPTGTLAEARKAEKAARVGTSTHSPDDSHE